MAVTQAGKPRTNVMKYQVFQSDICHTHIRAYNLNLSVPEFVNGKFVRAGAWLGFCLCRPYLELPVGKPHTQKYGSHYEGQRLSFIAICCRSIANNMPERIEVGCWYYTDTRRSQVVSNLNMTNNEVIVPSTLPPQFIEHEKHNPGSTIFF